MNADHRTIPHNLEAEQSVLGCVLIDNRTLSTVQEILQPGMFFRDGHRVVYEALVALGSRSSRMDLVTLKEELDRVGAVERAGGIPYVAALIDGVPTTTNVELYARIVREKWQRRNLILIGSKIVADGYEASESIEELIDRAEASVMTASRHVVSGDFHLADTWMSEVRSLFDEACRTKQIVTGIPSKLNELDQMTRGFQDGDLVYIGGRPSGGKTSLMLQLANAASEHTTTGIISVEMRRNMIGVRAVSMESGVAAFRILTGRVTSFEQRRIEEAIQRIEQRPIAIDDTPTQTPAQLRARVRRFAAKYGLGILFLDYMQLLRDDHGRYENRNQEIAAISASLKGLAGELGIPIIVLSQLSRAAEQRGGNRRPQLWDLRESGALEQDGDLVILLHRPGQHDEDKPKAYGDGEEAQLIVAKQRNGPTGTITLEWQASLMRFVEPRSTGSSQQELPA